MLSLVSSPNKTLELTLELAPNEFLAHDNRIGILPQDPDPIQFLTIEDKEVRTVNTELITPQDVWTTDEKDLSEDDLNVEAYPGL